MVYSRNNNIHDDKISPITIACIIVLAAVMGFFACVNDSGKWAAIRWLIVIFTMALVFKPYLRIDTKKIWDGGFAISFGMSLALSFLATWIIASTEVVSFAAPLMYAILIALSLIGVIVNYKYTSKDTEDFTNTYDLQKMLWGFTAFAVIFTFAFWIIGFNPTLDAGTENYMDYGFMQGIYRQERAVPWDIWFAGNSLNYYYLGQAAAVFMCRIAFTSPEYGYNLMLATFWGMTFVATGEITYGVVASIAKASVEDTKKIRIVASLASLVTSVYTAFGANGEWIIDGVITPIRNKIMGITNAASYWFPNATVYISTALGDADNGKNEFPAYSTILGDLHAHVCNVIFVLPLIAILFDYVFSKDKKRNRINLFVAAIMLALYKGSNFWDFAIYYVITGAVVVFCDYAREGFNIKSSKQILIKALLVTFISWVVILPFTLRFEKMASHIKLCQLHSTPYKLLVLWLIPLVITVCMLIEIFVYNDKLVIDKDSKLGILAISLCTMGLILVPEIVYVEDIYGIANARFNTMFKLTYQAFILFGILIGIAAGIYLINNMHMFVIISVTTIVLALYTPNAIKGWFGDIWKSEARKGISTVEALDEEYRIECEAARIINNDDRRCINIIEKAGDSYTHGDAVSVMTGTSTVVGWFVHEWMWRDDSDAVAMRSNEVRLFYEGGNENFCRYIIDEYNIDYIFVGPVELSDYNVNDRGFATLGDVLFEEETDYGKCYLIGINQ